MKNTNEKNQVAEALNAVKAIMAEINDTAGGGDPFDRMAHLRGLVESGHSPKQAATMTLEAEGAHMAQAMAADAHQAQLRAAIAELAAALSEWRADAGQAAEIEATRLRHRAIEEVQSVMHSVGLELYVLASKFKPAIQAHHRAIRIPVLMIDRSGFWSAEFGVPNPPTTGTAAERVRQAFRFSTQKIDGDLQQLIAAVEAALAA